MLETISKNYAYQGRIILKRILHDIDRIHPAQDSIRHRALEYTIMIIWFP